jgi:hypothetical protein
MLLEGKAMTVYVDQARLRFGRMRMSHMLADTEEELHAMAEKIGLKRGWFQDKASTPHYDVCQATREKAIAMGAVVADRRKTVDLIRKKRSSVSTSQKEKTRL